jgi:hypothetical protein
VKKGYCSLEKIEAKKKLISEQINLAHIKAHKSIQNSVTSNIVSLRKIGHTLIEQG